MVIERRYQKNPDCKKGELEIYGACVKDDRQGREMKLAADERIVPGFDLTDDGVFKSDYGIQIDLQHEPDDEYSYLEWRALKDAMDNAMYEEIRTYGEGKKMYFFPKVHVNAYKEERHYGGAEEGGWWYNSGEPVASVPVSSREELEQAKKILENNLHNVPQKGQYGYMGEPAHDYDDSGIYHTGVNLRISVEGHPPKKYPERRPYYE